MGLENRPNVGFETGPPFLPMERHSHEVSGNSDENRQIGHATPKPLAAASDQQLFGIYS